MSSDAVARSPAVVELSEADIPGASLEEPLDAYNVAALKWWLLCRGIKLQSSSRKKQLVARLVLSPVKSLISRKAVQRYTHCPSLSYSRKQYRDLQAYSPRQISTTVHANSSISSPL